MEAKSFKPISKPTQSSSLSKSQFSYQANTPKQMASVKNVNTFGGVSSAGSFNKISQSTSKTFEDSKKTQNISNGYVRHEKAYPSTSSASNQFKPSDGDKFSLKKSAFQTEKDFETISKAHHL